VIALWYHRYGLRKEIESRSLYRSAHIFCCRVGESDQAAAGTTIASERFAFQTAWLVGWSSWLILSDCRMHSASVHPSCCCIIRGRMWDDRRRSIWCAFRSRIMTTPPRSSTDFKVLWLIVEAHVSRLRISILDSLYVLVLQQHISYHRWYWNAILASEWKYLDWSKVEWFSVVEGR